MTDHFAAAKPQLSREQLAEINEVALWAGALMLASGAETDRIEETVHRMGTALGANWLDILISPNAIILTSSSGGEFRTRVRRVAALGVNMRILDEVNALSRRVTHGELDAHQTRDELARISRMPHYNRWLVVLMVALACASFARLFGGGAGEMAITFAASGAAMIVRQEFQRRYFNIYLTTLVTAFTAAFLALLGVVAGVTRTDVPLLSGVLLLVPGVHLVNAAEDILKGHLVTGVVRGLLGAVLAACIAIGMGAAMWLLNQALI
jgi:uncharacterized membrane protein YjjP (DUF1212 family)